MTTILKRFLAWFHTSKYILYVVVAAVAGIVAIVLRGLFTGTPTSPNGTAIPPPPLPMEQAVADAHEASLKARIAATSSAAASQAHVDEISKIDDGAERRRQLALLLSGAAILPPASK